MMFDRPIDQFVSGPEGVSEGQGLGGVLLPIDPPVSPRGAVRTHSANQARGGIGAGQYCGRSWARKYRQLRAVPESLTGLPKGARDAHAFSGAGWCLADAGSSAGSRPVRELGQNASCFDTVAAGKGRHPMTPFAIRHSLFAKARSAIP